MATQKSDNRDPQWPNRFGRIGASKPLIIGLDPIIPVSIAFVLFGTAAYHLLAPLFGHTPPLPDDTVLALTIFGGFGAIIYWFIFGHPRAVFTKTGVHLPPAKRFFPWEDVLAIHAGYEGLLKRNRNPSIAIDVAASNGQAAVFNDVPYAPNQPDGVDRFVVDISGTIRSPEGTLLTIQHARGAPLP